METARLRPEQQNYLEGMKILLELYYLIKPLAYNQWFSKPVIKTMAKLFNCIIPHFSPCVYLQDEREFRYCMKKIVIRQQDFETFLEYISYFSDLCKDEPQKHFALLNVFYEIDNPMWSRLMKITKVDYENSKVNLKWKNPYRRNLIRNGELFMSIFPRGWVYSSDYSAKLDKIYNADYVIYSQSFLVHGRTEFADKLISENPCKISSPGFGLESSFIEVIRSLIVIYHILLGSFERIKICKYSNCDLMLIEKKIRAKSFCCDDHKMKYNIENQPREVRLCRERQNNWLRNQLLREDIIFPKKISGKEIGPPKPDHVHKKECDVCTQQTESGLCQILRNKNIRAFQTLDKYPKRAKITHKIR
jgi:hypothetical protein